MRKLKKVLSLVLALAMVLSLCVVGYAADSAAVFTDYSEASESVDGAYEAVDVLVQLGYINGMTTTTFAPSGTLTRAQAAKIISYIDGGVAQGDLAYETQAETVFTDVSSTAWYSGVVAYAYNHGLISGTSATTYDPEGSLTTAAWLKLLLCAADIGDKTDYEGEGWDDAVVAAAVEAGILTEEEYEAFEGEITREIACYLAYSAMIVGGMLTEGEPYYDEDGNYVVTLTAETGETAIISVEEPEYDTSLGAYITEEGTVQLYNVNGTVSSYKLSYSYVSGGKTVEKTLTGTSYDSDDEIIATLTDYVFNPEYTYTVKVTYDDGTTESASFAMEEYGDYSALASSDGETTLVYVYDATSDELNVSKYGGSIFDVGTASTKYYAVVEIDKESVEEATDDTYYIIVKNAYYIPVTVGSYIDDEGLSAGDKCEYFKTLTVDGYYKAYSQGTKTYVVPTVTAVGQGTNTGNIYFTISFDTGGNGTISSMNATTITFSVDGVALDTSDYSTYKDGLSVYLSVGNGSGILTTALPEGDYSISFSETTNYVYADAEVTIAFKSFANANSSLDYAIKRTTSGSAVNDSLVIYDGTDIVTAYVVETFTYQTSTATKTFDVKTGVNSTSTDNGIEITGNYAYTYYSAYSKSFVTSDVAVSLVSGRTYDATARYSSASTLNSAVVGAEISVVKQSDGTYGYYLASGTGYDKNVIYEITSENFLWYYIAGTDLNYETIYYTTVAQNFVCTYVWAENSTDIAYVVVTGISS